MSLQIKIPSFLLLVLLLSACQSDNSNTGDALAQLEAEAKETKDPEAIGRLIQGYEAAISQNPEDAETNSAYLRKAADIMFESGRFSTSVEFLQRSIREYPNSNTTAAIAMYLGDIYAEKLGAKETASSVYQALAAAYPSTEEANLAKGKIENVAAISERLDTLLRNMVDPSTGRADYRVANEYVSSVENFTLINPKAAEAAPLLYKAAEVARSIRLHQRALDIYETICEQYPDYEKAGKAYFMRAFTLDEDLKKPEEARKMYQAFIDKFPNDDFADDAQILLDNIGKSEEEIFQQFEKQRQEQ